MFDNRVAKMILPRFLPPNTGALNALQSSTVFPTKDLASQQSAARLRPQRAQTAALYPVFLSRMFWKARRRPLPVNSTLAIELSPLAMLIFAMLPMKRQRIKCVRIEKNKIKKRIRRSPQHALRARNASLHLF